jgi:cyanate permease
MRPSQNHSVSYEPIPETKRLFLTWLMVGVFGVGILVSELFWFPVVLPDQAISPLQAGLGVAIFLLGGVFGAFGSWCLRRRRVAVANEGGDA